MLKPEENNEVVTLLFKTGESVMKTLGPRQGGFLLAIVDGDGTLCVTSNAAPSSLHPFLDAIRAYLDDNVKDAVMIDLAARKEASADADVDAIAAAAITAALRQPKGAS